MKSTFIVILLFVGCFLLGCTISGVKKNQSTSVPEKVYDEKGCLYTSYKDLVMAGYQGWFAAEGDDSNRGWYHYKNTCGFAPGCAGIDYWPDMADYSKKYISPFKKADGNHAFLYSAYDVETVDMHFKWMRDYGLDGVFMQRFVVEVKDSNPKGKRHFNKVLANALAAAKKYKRAIGVMYDLSGCSPSDVALVEKDWLELQQTFDLLNNKKCPTYLRHNKKPLLAIWGSGFNDKRRYSVSNVQQLVANLKGAEQKVSVLLGVPYYWRTLNKDTENTTALHDLIKQCDIIMPWAVGRYNGNNYNNLAPDILASDIAWCKTNKVDYVPLVFPGFSWGNLQKNRGLYNSIPREKGNFLWKQIAGAKTAGAQSLYVAMFDEIDEGTAIFKCAKEQDVPLNGEGKFVGIDNELPSDYYLWLTGQGARWFHGSKKYGPNKPLRK